MKRKKVETRKKLFLIFFKTICFVILGLRFWNYWKVMYFWEIGLWVWWD